MDFITAFGQSALWVGGWFPASLIALAISSALVAIAWMLGEAIKGSELKSWAKKEFNEFLFTCVLVCILTFALAALYAITISLGNGTNYTDQATNYFLYEPKPGESPDMEGLYYKSLKVASLIAAKAFMYEMIGDVRVNFTMILKAILWLVALIPGAQGALLVSSKLPDLLIKPFGAADDISSGLDSYASNAIFATMLAAAQIQMLKFFQAISLPILLPLGIALRSFTFTRKTGSTLIALAIIGAVVFPLSILASKAIYDETYMLFGSLPIPPITSDMTGVMLISPEQGAKVTLDDKISWGVQTGAKYRIWISKSDSGCGSCSGSDCTKESIPPNDPKFKLWYSNETLYKCMQLNSTFSGIAGSDPVEVNVSNLTNGKTDAVYSFVLDAYNSSGSSLGWVESRVILGDPCKEGFWSRVRCWRGMKYSVDVKSGKTINTMLLSTVGGMLGTLGDEMGPAVWGTMWDSAANSFTSSIKTLNPLNLLKIFGAFSTPTYSSYIVLKLTDNIPAMMFPPIMITLTLVMSSFICISLFRSLSEVLGGETELPGLGKIV